MLHTVRTNGSLLGRLLLGFALLSLAASMANAASLCVLNGTLASYITNHSTFGNACQIGDKLFWGFDTQNGSLSVGAEADPTNINVVPLPGDGLTLIGISFNSGGWDADGFFIDQIINYNVATLSGLPIIKDATLTVTGTLTGTGGSASVVETLTPAVPGSPITASLPSTVSVNINFIGNQVNQLFVSNRLTLFGGTGTAHISVMENDFSESIVVPEPVTSLSLGAGLLALGMAWRKRLARTSSEAK